MRKSKMKPHRMAHIRARAQRTPTACLQMCLCMYYNICDAARMNIISSLYPLFHVSHMEFFLLVFHHPKNKKRFKCNSDAVNLERFMTFNLLVKAIAVETISTNFQINQERMICLQTRKCKNEEFSTREKPFRWRLYYVYHIYFTIQRKEKPARFIEVAHETVLLCCDRIKQDLIKRNTFSCHSTFPYLFWAHFHFCLCKIGKCIQFITFSIFFTFSARALCEALKY